jgi:hypothetical protein
MKPMQSDLKKKPTLVIAIGKAAGKMGGKKKDCK